MNTLSRPWRPHLVWCIMKKCPDARAAPPRETHQIADTSADLVEHGDQHASHKSNALKGESKGKMVRTRSAERHLKD